MLPQILLVVPSQAALDLHLFAIQTGQQHLADLPPVHVNLDPLDRYRLTGDHIDQTLLKQRVVFSANWSMSV